MPLSLEREAAPGLVWWGGQPLKHLWARPQSKMAATEFYHLLETSRERPNEFPSAVQHMVVTLWTGQGGRGQ